VVVKVIDDFLMVARVIDVFWAVEIVLADF
jgi:hypothetical protein